MTGLFAPIRIDFTHACNVTAWLDAECFTSVAREVTNTYM